MSTDRDTTRIVRSWLEEGATALPDRVLDAVLDQVPATRQRRSWWPAWRSAQRNSVRIAIAAAAVLVIAIASYTLLPLSGSIGNPGASPSPTPRPVPTFTHPEARPPRPIPSGSMAPGIYLVSDPTLTLRPYDLTVPAGWIGGDGARRGPDPIDSNAVRLTTWIITHVYSDSCHWTGTLVPVADKAALVAALTAQVGHTHSTPVETAIGGLPATKITFSLDRAFDVKTCDSGVVRLWPEAGPDESGGWLIYPSQTDTAFVIEAKGKVMILMTVQRDDSPAADVAALQQILASVEFQPTP